MLVVVCAVKAVLVGGDDELLDFVERVVSSADHDHLPCAVCYEILTPLFFPSMPMFHDQQKTAEKTDDILKGLSFFDTPKVEDNDGEDDSVDIRDLLEEFKEDAGEKSMCFGNGETMEIEDDGTNRRNNQPLFLHRLLISQRYYIYCYYY